MRSPLGAALTVVAVVLVVIGASFFYRASEDAEGERDYRACLERERAAYDAGERLVEPEDACAHHREG